jgi:glycine/D-amino acid oxidase-like deaminating enzyme
MPIDEADRAIPTTFSNPRAIVEGFRAAVKQRGRETASEVASRLIEGWLKRVKTDKGEA